MLKELQKIAVEEAVYVYLSHGHAGMGQRLRVQPNAAVHVEL
ncbi:MAG: hypothetical protein NZ651_05525 [Candidatus Bipolaricaulota bacterium]|nr:hypothetical protein [Candidatus Bipolaricaulota bacterium]MDW8127214.1 hypothetical protein [Candidatus Bipolaricaulota bacterium]